MTSIGFIGMGRMGSRMAKNINKKYETYVWNRTSDIAKNHSIENNTKFASSLKDIAYNCNIIFLCLSTSDNVIDVINTIKNDVNKDTYIIDCTSADCFIQKQIYNDLKQNNIYYLDAPVSGGPTKAELGTLTAMVGGDKDKYDKIEEILKTFSIPIYVGDIGNGCAIKSVNNILNVSHLCLAAEALSSLEKYGINKKTALKVINQSSGRSLSTMERIPIHVMEKNYNYGFALDLMDKDVDLALKIIDEPIMFSNISNMLKESLEKYGKDADYTEITKLYFEE